MGKKREKLNINNTKVLPKEKTKQLKDLLNKLSELEKKKVEKLPEFIEDWNKMKELFNNHLKGDKKYVEYLINTLDFWGEKNGVKNYAWAINQQQPFGCDDFDLGENPNDKFLFGIQALRLEIQYGVLIRFEYANGKFSISRFRALWPWDNFLKFRVGKIKTKKVFVDTKIKTITGLIGEDLNEDEIRGVLIDTVDHFIPRISIASCLDEATPLTNILHGINRFMPTLITYVEGNLEDENDNDRNSHSKMFLLSIPRHSNLKEVNRDFSKSITAIHKRFFNSYGGGRPRYKKYQQEIFNREFTALRKKKYSIPRACKSIAENFKDELSGINWASLERHYYPVWKKRYGKRGVQKK